VVSLTDPTTWDVWMEIYVGVAITVLTLVIGYYLGVAWQRWRDGTKRKS
jgi:hypothetical protein